MAYIAHMKGILGKSPRVDYTPNSATGDEMRLAEMTFAAPPAPTSPDHQPRERRETACSHSSGAGCIPAHCH